MAIYLLNDYGAAAHPAVISAITDLGDREYAGYGMDELSAEAASTIKGLTGRPDADVHFLIGGTGANLTALAAFLRSTEAVISPSEGHINVHESGAIEASGHKILTVPTVNGKAAAADVREMAKLHTDEHTVIPRLVFISQSTEYGTVYTLDELRGFREVCDELGLYFYLDGARLGYAIAAEPEASFKAIAELTDAFYIGGTKNGLLMGEAMVISNDALKKGFRNSMKQRGSLLAKGFLIGAQFSAILKDGLYIGLADHANKMANLLTSELKAIGVEFALDGMTNQIFPVVPTAVKDRLEMDILLIHWGKYAEGLETLRLTTTWQTTEETVAAVVDIFKAALG
ncbi:MAG: aminotransferase class I/II-fold pyridoxal phosphate-dependent enzyme [Clostridiales Family XIII bacterium]|jgi:threonine aldolase|nr:aminotransferase class I/II-fold pyridoxal phosphate-dependent enzyme [Clostridiales Family XIII bacterium]